MQLDPPPSETELKLIQIVRNPNLATAADRLAAIGEVLKELDDTSADDSEEETVPATESYEGALHGRSLASALKSPSFGTDLSEVVRETGRPGLKSPFEQPPLREYPKDRAAFARALK